MARGSPDWRQYGPQKSYEQLTREQNGFWEQTLATGGAGTRAWCQLINPSGSGINVLIHRIEVYIEDFSSIYIGSQGATLSTLDGTGDNRYIGGPVSSALIYRENKAGVPTNVFLRYHPWPFVHVPIPNSYAWLAEGKDIVVANSVDDVGLWVNFWWFEMVDF